MIIITSIDNWFMKVEGRVFSSDIQVSFTQCARARVLFVCVFMFQGCSSIQIFFVTLTVDKLATHIHTHASVTGLNSSLANIL